MIEFNKEEIKEWFEKGRYWNCSHVIVIYCHKEMEFFPVYVTIEENVVNIVKEFWQNYANAETDSEKIKVAMVLNMKMEFDDQMNKQKRLNY